MVTLPSKFILDLVLCFYGLDRPEYTCSPQPNGTVKSTVVFVFPYMENFQFGGKIGIEGYAYTSSDSDEEAAYEALLFIEKNFMTKVVDLNYYQRKKEVKIQKTLISMLSQTLELSDSLKMMFGEMINAVEGKLRQFSFDCREFFSGPMAAGQIEAYESCANGLKEVHQYAVKCFADCEPQFVVLNKLSWKLAVLQSNLCVD